jgi:UDP-GlcNAc:undecaprenyl-phosphate GlcNAc-1-phosphate transferase
MTTYMLIFAGALIVAVSGTPVARKLGWQLGIIDQPSARKVHLKPIPRLGGLAIYVAFILALLIFEDRFRIPQLVSILIGATLVSFLGIWDDRWSLRPILKLLGQMVAALILVFSGVQVQFLPYSFLNVAVTILWVVGITNALNLLDNMDGLSGGVGAVAAAFFLLLAAMNGQYLVGGLAAALLGACLGFLIYNFNPATIFMGDTGSLFLGFMGDTGSLFLGFILAALGIKLRFPGRPSIVTWMVPALVLGLPVFDTTLVVISRLRRGVPFYQGGKDHVSHRLVTMGLTQREAVLILHLVCGALGVLAIFITQASLLEGYVIGGTVVLTGLLALVKLEGVDVSLGRNSADHKP